MHFSNSLLLIILPVQIILLAAVVSLDYLNRKHHFFKISFFYVIFDEFMHLAHYTAVMLPLASKPLYFAAGAAASVLIDLDHFIAAGSFRVKDLVSMESRPAAHSLLFLILFSAAIYLLTQNLLLAGALFSGMFIHLTRDMIEGRTYILYPIKRLHSFPFAVYILISAILAAANILISSIPAS